MAPLATNTILQIFSVGVVVVGVAVAVVDDVVAATVVVIVVFLCLPMFLLVFTLSGGVPAVGVLTGNKGD